MLKIRSVLSTLFLSLLLAVAAVAFAQSGGSMSGGAASGGALKPSNPGHPSQQELNNADQSTTDWLMMNKGYSATRYSTLNQINTSNVGSLEPTCAISLGDPGRYQATPQVYDGIIYITTNYNTYAIDATNCKKLWEYDYKPTGPEAFIANRGVALYNGMVFHGTSDGHVIALDMRTGKLLWNVHPVNSAMGASFEAAPLVYNGLLLIGTAGADIGSAGEMFAFDTATGKQVWSFSEIKPDTFGSDQTAASTGGGSNWSSYALDPNTGLVYIPVGNPAPDYNPDYRPGDNLYTDSVVVLDAMTGKLSHYYQQVPHDSHDYDTVATPILFEQNGTKYLAVSNKQGYLYVYNDDSKKLSYKTAVTTVRNQDVPLTTAGVYACPGSRGGSEWDGPSYNPTLGLLYTNTDDWCATFSSSEQVNYIQGHGFTGGKRTMDPVSKAQGWTTAVDATTGNIVWQRKSTTPMLASVTPTAGGLLFTGDLNGHFLALNGKTGDVLYSFNTGGAIAGGISTYEISGKQYVAVAVGSNSGSFPYPASTPEVFVFSLK